MSRRDFKRVVNDENRSKALTKIKKTSVGEHDRTRLHADMTMMTENAHIKDLSAHLKIRAERIRIQARKGMGEFGDVDQSHMDNTKTPNERMIIPDHEKIM